MPPSGVWAVKGRQWIETRLRRAVGQRLQQPVQRAIRSRSSSASSGVIQRSSTTPHGQATAIPCGLGGIGGQGAVDTVVADKLFEVSETGRRWQVPEQGRSPWLWGRWWFGWRPSRWPRGLRASSAGDVFRRNQPSRFWRELRPAFESAHCRHQHRLRSSGQGPSRRKTVHISNDSSVMLPSSFVSPVGAGERSTSPSEISPTTARCHQAGSFGRSLLAGK
jgi:hypothetical protein